MFLFFAFIENEEVRSYLEKLFYEYRKISYSKALKIVKHREAAEDVVQQVFINIAEYLDNKSNTVIKNEIAFITGITRNVAIDYLKKHRIHENISEIDDLENFTFIDPEVNIIRMDQVYEFTKKIEQMNPDYANLIMLKYSEEMEIYEIARMLNLSEDTTRKKISRARRAFMKILSEGEKYA